LINLPQIAGYANESYDGIAPRPWGAYDPLWSIALVENALGDHAAADAALDAAVKARARFTDKDEWQRDTAGPAAFLMARLGKWDLLPDAVHAMKSRDERA